MLELHCCLQMYLPKGNHYEWAFHSPHINWTVPDPKVYDVGPAGAVHNYTTPEGDLYINMTIAARTREQYRDFWKNFRAWDLRRLGADSRVVHFTVGTGTTVRLTWNHFLRDELQAMGVRQETIFGCGADFLFAPQPELRARFAGETAALGNPDTLKIGIQIRNRDPLIFGKVRAQKYDREVSSSMWPSLALDLRSCLAVLVLSTAFFSNRERLGNALPQRIIRSKLFAESFHRPSLRNGLIRCLSSSRVCCVPPSPTRAAWSATRRTSTAPRR
jgi:hypothetical protein